MQLKSKELREDTGLQARQISFREQEKQAADHDATLEVLLPWKFRSPEIGGSSAPLWLKPASNANEN